MITTNFDVEMGFTTQTLAEQGVLTLLHGGGVDASTTITDELGNTWTAVADAQIDTAQYKFLSVGSSIKFDGTGDYISTPDDDKWAFAGDFTIDFWVRFAALPAGGAEMGFFRQVQDANNLMQFRLLGTGPQWQFYQVEATVTTINVVKATTVAVDTWYHVALVRSGNDFMIFQDGVQVGTTVTDTTAIANRTGDIIAGNVLNGWLADYRITNSALWTADFTPPSRPIPATSPVWTSVKSDTRTNPITVSWGIKNIGPTERIADTGTINLTLDNSEGNSTGTLGYYSPDTSDCRTGFAIGTPIRVKVVDTPTSDTSDTVTKYHAFYLTDIVPDAGKKLTRGTVLGGADYLAKMSSQYADALEVITNTSVDYGLDMLYNIMPVPPVAVQSSSGVDALSYIFQDVDGKKSTIFNMGQRLVVSDLGYIFCCGDSTYGETMSYQTRHDRLSTSSCVTLSDTMSGLIVQHGDKNIYNHITAISYPLDIGSSETSDAETLYTLQREIELKPGLTLNYTFRFRDPNAGSAVIHLYPDSQIEPTSDEYKVSSVAGDGGDDMTSDVTITATWYADHADVDILNNGSVTGYLNTLLLKGRAIRMYDPAESVASGTSDNLAAYGKRALRFTLPYQDNPNTATDFADHLLTKWGTPNTQVESVEFWANRDQTLYTAAVGCGVGSKITLVETVTGINDEYSINGVEWVFNPDKSWKVKWFLEKATGAEFWFLGVAGLSELESTTILGF